MNPWIKKFLDTSPDVNAMRGALSEIQDRIDAETPPVLKIEPDDHGESPREYDNLGRMACWHDRYKLGDEQPKCSGEEWLETLEPDSVILPLYLYDHGGITMSTGRFSCPWDSGQVGWIVCEPSKIVAEYGADTPEIREKVTKGLESEVRVYDWYLTGQVFGFTYGDDSCWGFLGESLEDTGILDHLAPHNIPRDVIDAAWDARFETRRGA